MAYHQELTYAVYLVLNFTEYTSLIHIGDSRIGFFITAMHVYDFLPPGVLCSVIHSLTDQGCSKTMRTIFPSIPGVTFGKD